MKVNIVCNEDVNAWIIGKFTKKMHENLIAMGIESTISKKSDPNYDINHFNIYFGYKGLPSTIDTLMITHLDDIQKLNLVRKQLETAAMGICMSKETMLKLMQLGIPGNKISYINPAHDGIIKPRKIIVGITCRVQNDGRKREIFLDSLATILNPETFMFKIMGENWDNQVLSLRKAGFEVEHYNTFIYDKYVQLIPSLDYYLYMGQDEGQMGFIDALSAGVKTITTPQGYHLDAPSGITYPFITFEDLVEVFSLIERERSVLIKSVESWNWLDYTRKHVEIWEYLMSVRNNSHYSQPEKTNYVDGIHSVFKTDEDKNFRINKSKELRKLRIEYYRHLFYKVKGKLSTGIAGISKSRR